MGGRDAEPGRQARHRQFVGAGVDRAVGDARPVVEIGGGECGRRAAPVDAGRAEDETVVAGPRPGEAQFA